VQPVERLELAGEDALIERELDGRDRSAAGDERRIVLEEDPAAPPRQTPDGPERAAVRFD